jgi:uncharacterized RDD family membrane protein YckC
MRSLRLKVLVAASAVLIALSAGIVTAQVSRRPVRLGFRPSPIRFVQITSAAPAPSRPAQKSPAPKTTELTPWEARQQAWKAQEDRLDHDPRAQVWSHPVLRVGQDYTLKEADTARNVAVIFGSATIDGFVDGDVFVWLGDVQLSNTAVIRGSLVVIGGNATVASNAVIRRDLVVIGGLTELAAGFFPGGEHVAFGATGLGDRIRQVVPWITRGLLWGRPIVPNLSWVWWIFGLFFTVHFLMNLVFHEPVRATAKTLAARPLSAFMAGLLVLLLTGPLALLLVMSVIGILVVPFALCAVVVAWAIGKVAVTRAIGARVVQQESAESRPQSMRSFLIGAAVIALLYMIPVVGLMTWALIGVFGLGSAVLSFFSAMRRENPAPPKKVAVPLATPPSAPPPAPATSHGYAPPATAASSVASNSESAEQPNPDSLNPPTPSASAWVPPANPAGPAVADLTAFPRAYFFDRLAAFALDLLLVFIAVTFFGPYRRDEERFLLFLLVYYVGFWTWKGTTVGGIICNLRVVRADGAPLRFVDAVVRGLSGVFSIAALGLGGLWILRDPERQAWHDKISATYVVKVPRNYPLP